MPKTALSNTTQSDVKKPDSNKVVNAPSKNISINISTSNEKNIPVQNTSDKIILNSDRCGLNEGMSGNGSENENIKYGSKLYCSLRK